MRDGRSACGVPRAVAFGEGANANGPLQMSRLCQIKRNGERSSVGSDGSGPVLSKIDFPLAANEPL